MTVTYAMILLRRIFRIPSHALSIALLLTISWGGASSEAEEFKLKEGDRICYIGNTLADRMQHHGWLETMLQATHPELKLSVRNLGFPGDEVETRPRSASFGSPDEWLTKTQADVVFCFFGYNEAQRGPAGLRDFKRQLGEMIDQMQEARYNGESAPRIVVFSPIAHEDLGDPNLPDGKQNNLNLAIYTKAMRDVCADKEIRFVDLFHPTQRLFRASATPLTMNGIHLLEEGNKALAAIVMLDLFPDSIASAEQGVDTLDRLRQAILERNYYWFSRYRVVDGYNVYGGRSKLAWHGQSNFDVMQREMEVFDVMTSNRDAPVWEAALGREMKVVDDNLPELLPVKTNKVGPLEAGAFPYLGGEEAIEKMTVADGMQINLFASEEMFPEIVNPVQMAVSPDSKLYVSVWPSYPHWNPTEPRLDRIVCLPDEDGDGVADKCVIFADQLNSITGLEFWGGGMIVAAPPELWFLKDTDGDDVADKKLRILQGISSADTHHSANAMVMGPDGGIYFSRGIFNVANMETPTGTYRSTRSGVHRFDPRTFQMSFHFPIGPNPHGDVFDQWGYQFANDGTSGTGSYVNIGQGVGNKPWFKKRVRPVAATGILSSEHFPESNQGNFLICNTIGVLGVLQHEVHYDGADISAVEIEPIVTSSDQNFRPTDVEIGGDGALYISDWCNVLIGHMQHNMRDPNRDHRHGRIYRVTAKGRDLLTPIKMIGKPIDEVLEHFHSKTNAIRYRARLELSARTRDEIATQVEPWAAKLDVSNPNDAQALLECLWTFEEQRLPNGKLLATLMQATEPRVRAAAIRTLGHWGETVSDWKQLLMAAAQDESPLVRAEAVKAAPSFSGIVAAEAIFEVANQPTDVELDTVIDYAKGRIGVDQVVQDAIESGHELSQTAQQYVLRNARIEDLLRMDRSEAVYHAILNRDDATASQIRDAATGLAEATQVDRLSLLIDLVANRDANDRVDNMAAIGKAIADEPLDTLIGAVNRLQALATSGKNASTRQVGYALWMVADRSAKAPFAAATDKDSIRDLLAAVSSLPTGNEPTDAYEYIRPLIFGLPGDLAKEAVDSQFERPGIRVDLFDPNPSNADAQTFAKAKAHASSIVPEISIDVPLRTTRDAFGLRFSGKLRVDDSAQYRFFTNSDDGSRLYIDGKLVVNNDGNHGMSEKSGRIRLDAGMHDLLVTYYDNGGSDGLQVSWSSPNIRKQPIPKSLLYVSASATIHDLAIRAAAALPSDDEAKFDDFARVIQQGHHLTAAVESMLKLPRSCWNETQMRPTAEALATYVSNIPADLRTTQAALDAMQLTDRLADGLPPDDAQVLQSRIASLKVSVIRIGTVPERMIYDKERLAVQAGKPVEFIFTNTDNMPHNFAIIEPGSLVEVGELAEATAREEDALARNYIPTSDKILVGSRLLQPKQTQAFTFTAPTKPGIYPYVCTYPGHWRRMFGALYVVDDLVAYASDPAKYLAANPLPMRDEMLKFTDRNTEWTFDQLSDSVAMLADSHVHEPRQFEVGKRLFTVATCVSCHKLNGEGREFGPDLTRLDPKKRSPESILRSILEPSLEISEGYQSYQFELDSGKLVTGLIVRETDDQVDVIEDPVVRPDATVLEKAQIEERTKLTTSTMPKGLLNQLSREEILDLIAYVYTGGDKTAPLFAGGHHDHHSKSNDAKK